MTVSGFFGELYLRSTLPFLDARRTEAEVELLARELGDVRGPIVDLGCGHGRHASRLQRRLGRPVIGLELDRLSLQSREGDFSAVRADLRRLPFRRGSLGAIYAWYSTLFVFTDAEHAALLRGISETLQPGGRLIFHTVPFDRFLEAPGAEFSQTLPDGGLVHERSTFDPVSRRDRGHRRLELPDGRVLEASYAIRYHPLDELSSLLSSAGFRIRQLWGDSLGGPFEPGSRELIVDAERFQPDRPR